jgi:hypothetical protein
MIFYTIVNIIEGTFIFFNIMEGHSKATMCLTFNNAAQGLLSSFFFKYAGKSPLLNHICSCHSLFLMGISNPHCMHQTLSFFKGLHLAQF